MPHPIANTHNLLARALAAHQAGNLPQAEFLYKLVLQADRKQFDALNMLGVLEGQRGNFPAGLQHLKAALRIKPKSPDALINLGRMQNALGAHAEAVGSYEKALALNPQSALAHNNLSAVLRRLRRGEEALAHCDAALAIASNSADTWNNRGNVLFDLGRLDAALASYDRALEIDPKLAQSHLGRGNVLQLQVLPDQALAAFERALAIRSDFAEAWFGRGMAMTRLGRPEDVYASYDRAFRINPNLPYLEGDRLLAKMQICAWDDLESECARLAAGTAEGAPRSRPGILLIASASPVLQKKCTETYMVDRHPASLQPLWRGEAYDHQRLRVAYVSPDLREHAVSFLAAGMFEAHDRSRFETIAVSVGPVTADGMQARLRGAFDRFLDIGAQSDRDVAESLRELEVDILVDLGGLTDNARPGLLAQRAAPLQVNYLGYPGTMGASYVDYMIADQTVVPPQDAVFYTEKIVSLPHTYQVNDAGRTIAELPPTRDDLGLRDGAFVFCCFNNSQKITPPVFDVWMRLLEAVEGSVLWLMQDSAAAAHNLRREAEARGIAAGRLVSAPRVAPADHLARHRAADLFLDTLPYNAHTTASDALWTGLPVLTCLGSTFAGRVAASLLKAVGLPELITASLSDYEALALRIARDPPLCASLKEKLARNRRIFPLFDTAQFTQHIEAAYMRMWQRHRRGEPPQDFAVEPIGGQTG